MARKSFTRKYTTSRKMATIQKAKNGNGNSGKEKPLLKKLTTYSGLAFLCLVALAGIISGYFWLAESYQSVDEVMPIRVVEIEGELNHVTREQIIEQLVKSSISDQVDGISEKESSEIVGFFNSDLQLKERQIESIPWLQKAQLRRIWPDRIQIKVKEHKAIAQWNEKSLINEFGNLFTPASRDGLEHLPLLTGPEEQLQQLLKTFREVQDLLQKVDLQLAVLNLNHRYSWSLKLVNGIELQIGREHLLERVERFITLYPLLQRESELPIAKIDLRYDTGLAVTRLDTSERQARL